MPEKCLLILQIGLTMGKEKYSKDIGALFARSPVVSHSSIARIIKKKNKSGQYAKRYVNYMLAKGKIRRLAKGYYTASDDISLAVFCFQPAYYGLQDAMSFHNIWEQETIPIIITTKKIRQGMRIIFGQNVLIRRIQKKYFFGIGHILQGNVALPYSDIEKTFIDMIYFNEKPNNDVIAEFRKKIDYKKLNMYLKKYPRKTQAEILSYS